MRITLSTLVVAILAVGVGAHSERAHAGVAPAVGRGEGQAPRFTAEGRIVTVDVVVLDESGAPIEGLTPDDFTITDEGRPRPLSRFEAVTLPESPPTASGDWIGFASTNTSAGGPSLRTFVVVFDDVHMAPATAWSSRRAVSEFVETLREGDRVSLVPTSGGAWWHARIPEGQRDLLRALRLLVGQRPRRFSPDRMSDYEAMRLHLHRDPGVAKAVTRRYLDNDLLGERADPNAWAGAHVPAERRDAALGYTFTHPLILGRAAEVYYEVQSRKQATYGILQRVAAALEATRGRKSILFVSEGFIQEPGLLEHRDMLAIAQRANAAIHFLDARGLVGLPASVDVETGRPTGGFLSDKGDVLDQMNEPHLESLGAVSLAVDTGGRVIRNTNDLSRGFRRLERESRAYYLLGFEPTGVDPDGSFHRLEVDVHRPGVEVLARKGYYAPSSEPEPPSDADTFDPRLRTAMDSPFDVEGVPLRMASYVLGPAEGKTRALFVAEVDVRALAFEENGERFETILDILLLVSDSGTGERVARQHEIALSFPPRVFEQVRATGLPLMIDVPLGGGRHQARLLVRDQTSGAIGTVGHEIEVPPADAFRISTPVLTDILVPGAGDDSASLRPRPLARRVFPADRTITLSYGVYGAEARAGAAPRVVASFHVESAGGAVLATQPEAVLVPGPGGEIAQTAPISLAGVPPGLYAVVVSARDEETGRETTTHAPFRVAPPPGTAIVTEAPSAGPAASPSARRDQ